MKLRDYQVRIKKAQDEWFFNSKEMRAQVYSPTGSGKTVLFSDLIKGVISDRLEKGKLPRILIVHPRLALSSNQQQFGSNHNLIFRRSVEDLESTEKDIGIDHYAITETEKPKKYGRREAVNGSPVYIQTKGTTDHSKEHMTNDGSRIMNFLATAQAEALSTGHSYQARYILVTLGEGINWALKESTKNIIEVINYDTLKRYTDSEIFFNRMREDFGISLVDVKKSAPDLEFLDIQKESVDV